MDKHLWWQPRARRSPSQNLPISNGGHPKNRTTLDNTCTRANKSSQTPHQGVLLAGSKQLPSQGHLQTAAELRTASGLGPPDPKGPRKQSQSPSGSTPHQPGSSGHQDWYLTALDKALKASYPNLYPWPDPPHWAGVGTPDPSGPRQQSQGTASTTMTSLDANHHQSAEQ